MDAIENIESQISDKNEIRVYCDKMNRIRIRYLHLEL